MLQTTDDFSFRVACDCPVHMKRCFRKHHGKRSYVSWNAAGSSFPMSLWYFDISYGTSFRFVNWHGATRAKEPADVRKSNRKQRCPDKHPESRESPTQAYIT